MCLQSRAPDYQYKFAYRYGLLSFVFISVFCQQEPKHPHGWQCHYINSGGTSIEMGGGGGARKNVKWGNVNSHEACKYLIFLPFLCWNHQIWSNFNAYMSLFFLGGSKLGGKKIYFGGDAPIPPVALQLYIRSGHSIWEVMGILR